MRTFSRWIIVLCASPAGVIVLAALDSTLFFSLPFGIDAAVILLAARLRDMWWIVPLIATAGSVGGAAITFWMGMKIGDQGLEHWVSHTRLLRIRAARMMTAASMPKGSEKNSVESSAARTTTPAGDAHRAMIQ